MAKEGSVAPKERINIKYVPATGDNQAETELPQKLLVIGDFKGGAEEASIEDREAVSVDKNNFQSVMREAGLSLQTSVPSCLEDEKTDQEIGVDLQFQSLEDFGPDSIARQIPELQKLVELREALVALKGPLGNVPAFRERLQALIEDPSTRDQLLSELDLIDTSKSAHDT